MADRFTLEVISQVMVISDDMRAHIGLLAQSKSIHSIIDANQRE